MKIMWHSCSGDFATGYGVLTKLFTSKLKEKGFDVTILDSAGYRPTHYNSDGIQVLAKLRSTSDFGQTWLMEHFNYIQPDILFSLIDIFVLQPSLVEPYPWIPWVVIDSDPLNPVIGQRLLTSKAIATPSRYAEQVVSLAGFSNHYCPYAFDTEVFYPEDIKAAKKQLSKDTEKDITDKFFVSYNAANVHSFGRKNFGRLFEIWSIFIKSHPDAVLYCHTAVSDEFGGERLYRMVKFFNIPDENIIFAPQYHYKTGLLDQDYLRLIYSASDCYFCPSKGEAFGLPIIEAQLCGAPAIVTDCSAMTELCYSGQVVPGRRHITNFETFWTDIYVDKALESLEFMYQNRGNQELRDQASEGAKEYDVDLVLDKYMIPMFKDVLGKMEAGTLDPPFEHSELNFTPNL